MAEQSREPRERSRTQPEGGRRGAESRTEPAPAGGGQPGEERRSRPRTERYLVAVLPPRFLPPGTAPVDVAALTERLEREEDVAVLRTIRPQRRSGRGYPTVLVVETTAERAATLAATPELHVEVDQPLRYGDAGLTVADPGTIPPGEAVTVTFAVTDDDGRPLPGAAVYLLSPAFPGFGVAGSDGRAAVTVPAAALASVTGVYAQPRADCWSTWTAARPVSAAGENPVVCRRIGEPERYRWSARLMGFDRLPPTFRGHGVRIGLIDSGVTTTHPDLIDRISGGRDIVGGDEKSWQEDLLGVGTHAAALIAGTNGTRVGGLAPEVAVHAYKVQPGGRFSDLIEAVDRCVTDEVDVMYVPVGSRQPSWLVAYAIEEARQDGVACVAAAGNTGGGVLFPAALTTVLAVAAVGLLGMYPPDSYHATQLAGLPTPDGIFAPRFGGYGPEVDVCAPGVGVVAAAPGGGVTAIDGTGVAAAHVAAVAALVLAHHPDFRTHRERDAARVDRLCALIRSACRPVPLPEPGRAGVGMPDVAAAVGLVPAGLVPTPPGYPTPGGAGTPPARTGQVLPLPSFMAGGTPPATGNPLAPLRAALRAAGLLASE